MVIVLITPFLSVRETVPDLWILTVGFGKNVDTNISTSNGTSSGPTIPGCLVGMADKTFLTFNGSPSFLIWSVSISSSPNTAFVNCKNINISAKKINPAGCTNLLYDKSQSLKFLPVLIKYENFWNFLLSCIFILSDKNPLLSKYWPPLDNEALISQLPDDGINTLSYGNSISAKSLNNIWKNISIESVVPLNL